MILEREIESFLRESINKIGGRCLKWVSPGTAGVPDRIVLYNGKVYFIEVKRPGGTLSKLQQQFGNYLVTNGFNYYIIMSKYDVEFFINALTKGELQYVIKKE